MTSKTIKQQETKLHIDILYEKNCLPERGWGRKNCLHNHGAWNTHPLSEKKTSAERGAAIVRAVHPCDGLVSPRPSAAP